MHENLIEYIERLTEKLPKPLGVVYLVCSGSEANELALRLARAHTLKDEVIVVDVAYSSDSCIQMEAERYARTRPGKS